jgi:hypothetical protein
MLPPQDYLLSYNNYRFPRQTLVLYTKPPYWIGTVMSFRSAQLMHAATSALESAGKIRVKAQVKGYHIIILYADSLEPCNVTLEDEGWNDLQATFEGMAEFYKAQEINRNEKLFLKYREGQ